MYECVCVCVNVCACLCGVSVCKCVWMRIYSKLLVNRVNAEVFMNMCTSRHAQCTFTSGHTWACMHGCVCPRVMHKCAWMSMHAHARECVDECACTSVWMSLHGWMHMHEWACTSVHVQVCVCVHEQDIKQLSSL